MLGVNVVEPSHGIGATSNTYGFYSITVPKGAINLSYSFIGFKTQRHQMNLTQDTVISLEMTEESEVLTEVVLTAEETIEKRAEMSVIDVPIQQIQKLPALMGEVDVLKTLQLLPGVQSGGEGTSGIYVRGGSPDQNLILLDGVPVYNASHLFGFFSVFNSDAIKNVKLTKGGFPARFGGRLSSVLEIDMKEGNSKEFKGSASVGLIASRLTLEGPIGKNGKTSYIVSGRRTYIDALAQPFIAAAEPGSRFGYYFGDLNAKVNHQYSDKDRLFVSAYSGIDKFYGRFKQDVGDDVYAEDFGLQWGNLTTAIRWNHLYSSKLFSNLTATFSRYEFSVGAKQAIEYSNGSSEHSELKYLSNIRDLGLKYDLEYHLNRSHTIRGGANYTNHNFRPGAIEVDVNTSAYDLDSVLELTQAVNSHDTYLYIEDEWNVSPRLRINGGLHFSMYDVEGVTYNSLQPRYSGRFLITDEWAFKASYAQMQQYLHLLSSEGAGLPTDLWVSSTDKIPPQTSFQWAAGVSRMLFNKGFEFSVEGYYKEMEGLISYRDGISFAGYGDWQTKIESGGLGTSYGLEVFLQKKKGQTTGWFGYTLSKSTRQFPDTPINQGKVYDFRYDRRHDISIVVMHKLSERIELSGTWVYGTGKALTLEKADYHDGNNVSEYEGRNGFREPDYHRLDLGVQFHKEKKKGLATWSVSVYNAYNRRNPYFIGYGTEFNESSGETSTVLKQYSLFPILPSFSYSFKF